jgi:hypothetical protein
MTHTLNGGNPAERRRVNLIMLALLEIPLVCFVIAPDWTPSAIDRARAWIGRHARRFVVTVLTVLGTLLVIKGLIELLS